MKICVYSEWLRTPTSGGFARGMLRELIQARPNDEFVFYVRGGTATSPVIMQFIASCPGANWRLYTDKRHRRWTVLRAMLGLERYCAISVDADVYLNMDVDYLGPKAVPLLVTIADLSALRNPSQDSLPWHGSIARKHSLRVMTRHAPTVVAISHATRVDLEMYSANLKGKIHVIYPGIDSEWHSTPLTRRSEDGRRPYWMWWGLITRRKNLHTALTAYKRALTETHNGIPDLLLVGNLGRDSADIPRLIERLGLCDHVRRVSPMSLAELIAHVDLSEGLVFPSIHEGFGIPVIEAMARGKAVLTSNLTSLPEVGGGFATLCDPNSVESVASSMVTLWRDRARQEAEREQRVSWARSFTHVRAAADYSRLVDAVLSEPT